MSSHPTIATKFAMSSRVVLNEKCAQMSQALEQNSHLRAFCNDEHFEPCIGVDSLSKNS